MDGAQLESMIQWSMTGSSCDQRIIDTSSTKRQRCTSDAVQAKDMCHGSHQQYGVAMPAAAVISWIGVVCGMIRALQAGKCPRAGYCFFQSQSWGTYCRPNASCNPVCLIPDTCICPHMSGMVYLLPSLSAPSKTSRLRCLLCIAYPR